MRMGNSDEAGRESLASLPNVPPHRPPWDNWGSMSSMAHPAAPAEAAPTATKLWTRAFILLCASTLAYCGSHYLVTPVLSLYVKELGGSTFVAGLIFAAFSVVSFIVRPL